VSRPALLELLLSRWRSFYREPSTLFWSFGFPLLMALALGVAFRNQPPEPAVCAIEAGPCAERLSPKLAPDARVSVRVLPATEIGGALRSGRAAIGVSCAAQGDVTYRFDPTRPESRYARAVVDDAIQRAEGRADAVHTDEVHATEPGSRYIDFLVPGLIGSNAMGAGLWGLGFALVDMRTRKLLKRLSATPMRRSDFLLSFVLFRALSAVIELPILLVFSRWVFDVRIAGSVALLSGVVILGSLVFAGLGLLVASRATNTQTVSGLINLASFPMYLCSGVFFSASRFPDAMQPFVRALPLTAMNDAMRAIMIDGAGVGGIAVELAILCAWGVGCFALALKIFRWR
jgi:ABC-type multidrug transport system permease subunit